jgi:hypothetical protein
VLAPIESRWPASARRRPFYLSVGDLSDASLKALVGNDAGLRHRFFGQTAADTPNNHRLVIHYNETFTDKTTVARSPSSPYDAFYLVAYAAAASGKRHPTGAQLAAAMSMLLPPGEKVPVGPSAILDGFRLLGDGKHIDLEGAIGPLDFDPKTGEAPFDNVITCFTADATGTVNGTRESGMVYDGVTGRLKGKLDCP